MAYLAHDQSNLPVHDVYMQLRYISDLILENQLSCHIWYFKEYQFQILKTLLFSCARLQPRQIYYIPVTVLQLASYTYFYQLANTTGFWATFLNTVISQIEIIGGGVCVGGGWATGGGLNPLLGLFGLAMSPRSASHRPNMRRGHKRHLQHWDEFQTHSFHVAPSWVLLSQS